LFEAKTSVIEGGALNETGAFGKQFDVFLQQKLRIDFAQRQLQRPRGLIIFLGQSVRSASPDRAEAA